VLRNLLPRSGAAVIVAACAFVVVAPGAAAQDSAAVSVDPTSGAPGQQLTITLKNYHACPSGTVNCITIDFLQPGKPATRIGTADSKGSSSFSGPVSVPPSAAAGSATIHAFSSTDDATTGFNVTNAPTPTTTIAGTTTSSSTSTSSSTTTLTTVVPPLTEPSTTTTIVTKTSSSHSDVPRYIAVALVVLAAAATAAVDTRMRRLGPPEP
jgi:hypothetical protein